MMDILMSETCWVHKKWNKTASDINLLFYFSTITMMHGPINIKCEQRLNPTVIYTNDFYATVTCSNKSNSSFSDTCNNFYSFVVFFCDKTVFYFLTGRCTIILRGFCSVIASFYYFETISAVSIICIHFRCRQFIKVFSSRSVPGNTKNQATNQPTNHWNFSPIIKQFVRATKWQLLVRDKTFTRILHPGG